MENNLVAAALLAASLKVPTYAPTIKRQFDYTMIAKARMKSRMKVKKK